MWMNWSREIAALSFANNNDATFVFSVFRSCGAYVVGISSNLDKKVRQLYYVAVPAEMTSPLFPQGKKFFSEAVQITVHQIFPRSKFGQGSFSLNVEF
jgi:hypothetical protein